jgi:hypothetical protein
VKKSARIVVLIFVILGSFPRILEANSRFPKDVPSSAIVEIVLPKAPGLGLRGSKWEISYEFRITNEASLWTQREKFKDKSTERVGDLIKESTVKRSLEAPSGQKLALEIPFDKHTLEKLKNQPTSRMEANELTSQAFLFYAVVTVYDAKLNKTFTIPVNRVWDFANFPDAKFEIRIEITGPDSYSVNSSRIKPAK